MYTEATGDHVSMSTLKDNKGFSVVGGPDRARQMKIASQGVCFRSRGTPLTHVDNTVDKSVTCVGCPGCPAGTTMRP